MKIKILTELGAVAVMVSAALLPAAAFADTLGIKADVTASAHAPGVNASVTAQEKTEANAKDRGDRELERRSDNLGGLSARIASMIKLSADQKAALQASLSAEVSALTSLKTKIDGDSDFASLKTDIQSITKGYRVYLLVLPQIRIAAAADRALSIADQMTALSAKLQARITADTSADASTLQTTYTDMQAKIADARVQANAAVSATVSLKPDNGDATIAAANTAALKTARADLAAATADLKAARKDIETVIKGLKADGSVTASTQ